MIERAWLRYWCASQGVKRADDVAPAAAQAPDPLFDRHLPQSAQLTLHGCPDVRLYEAPLLLCRSMHATRLPQKCAPSLCVSIYVLGRASNEEMPAADMFCCCMLQRSSRSGCRGSWSGTSWRACAAAIATPWGWDSNASRQQTILQPHAGGDPRGCRTPAGGQHLCSSCKP